MKKVALIILILHLIKGIFVTIIGSNGAGKSTLFQAISEQLIQNDKILALNGRDIVLLSLSTSVKRVEVFQRSFKGVTPNMTIEENLHLSNQKVNILV